MNIKELFFDAWVYLRIDKGNETIKEPHKVTGIMTDTDVPCVQTDASDVYDHINFIEPIPLTREILEKNGFVKWSDHSRIARSCSMLFDKNTSFCVQEIDGSDSYFTQINRCGAGSFEHMMHIKYVHQLQQLFRLCGIDKEITLTQL